MSDRNPAVQHVLNTLVPNPKLDGIALDVSQAAYNCALHMATLLADGPELTAGLRKLREAKDCFVIQALQDCNGLARRPVE